MFNRKSIATSLLLCSAVWFAAGCTDHNQLKQDLLNAAQKQEQIQSYRFSGHAELKLDAALFAGLPPLTAAMLSVFKESDIDYSGAVALSEPVRMESTVKVTPKGAGTPLEIPILLKDNKMYMQLPVINKPDEYLQLPLGASADRLKNTGHLGTVIGSKLLQGIDPNWLAPGNPDQKAASGEPASKTVTLQITNKNQKEAAAYVNRIAPALLDELMTSGLSSEALNGQWKKTAERLKLAAPTSISTKIDAQGFIREQSGTLDFLIDGSGSMNEIVWKHTIDDVNGTIAFTKEEPKQVKHISDVLRSPSKPPQK